MSVISFSRTGPSRSASPTEATTPAIVFVHGFGCARSDWAAQVAALSSGHDVIAVDLAAHGESPGSAADCTIERFGADVAELLRTIGLAQAVLVGHSMGCRVVVEAALQAPAKVAGLVLVDGSQFVADASAVLDAAFATPGGYASIVSGMFAQMFNERSDREAADAIIARARRLPPVVGMHALRDMARYDVTRLDASLSCLDSPVLALQSTYTNARRERQSLEPGATSPYLEMLGRTVRHLQIEIIPGIGHFPQIDAEDTINSAISRFLGSIRAQPVRD